MAPHPKLLLVYWAGADWLALRPLIGAGKMPTLRRIVETGVSGELRGLPPYLSPMQWNTLATGRHPAEHGIVGLLTRDAGSRVLRPVASSNRRGKALWTRFTDAGRVAHVVGGFASHPAEPLGGISVSEAFAAFAPGQTATPDGAVWPPEFAAKLQGCRVPPEEVERGLLRWFCPGLTPEHFARDRRPRKLLRHISELYSLHNAAVGAVALQSPDLLAVCLPFLERVGPDFAGHAAPCAPELFPADFELYRHILERACVLLDLLLGELLRRLGPGISLMLVSGHGFRAGRVHDAASRTCGFLAASGRLFQGGGRTAEGATIFDLAPTLLHAAGLPLGRELAGRVLADVAFASAGPRFVDSPDSSAASGPRATPPPPPSSSIDTVTDPVEADNAWSLGYALLAVGRLEEALPCFAAAQFARPESTRFATGLARCQARLGLLDEARSTLAPLRDFLRDRPDPFLGLAGLMLELDAADEALVLAARAAALGAPRAHVLPLEARANLRLRRSGDAEAAARAWRAERPADSHARLALLAALHQGGRFAEAKAEAEALLAAEPGWAYAWFVLGDIASKKGDARAAEVARARARALHPELVALEEGAADDSRRLDANGFMFHEFANVDFNAGPIEAPLSREPTERLARLRAASAEQRATLARVREAGREAASPCSGYAGAVLPAPSTPGDFIVRAPWPDEEPRLLELLQSPGIKRDARLRVVVHPRPERIVGGFALALPPAPENPGVLQLRLRPAFVGAEAHDALLAAARGLAREAGLRSLVVTLPADAPEERFLLDRGATRIRTDLSFAGDLTQAWERLRPMLERLPAAIAGHAVRPLQEADHPAVAAMAAAHGLLGAGRAALALREDYDQAASLVCAAPDGQLVGALLVKPTEQARVYVEIRMVHPDHAALSGPINRLLITRACERWLAAGYTTFSLSCQTEKDRETVNFARRMRCRQSGESHTLRWSW